MRKLFTLILLLVSAASVNELFAQDINISADSVKGLLCRKWVFNYAIEDGQKLGAMPGAPTINYDFKKDGTIVATANGKNDALPGTWKYDAAKKSLKAIVNNHLKITITVLTQDQLTMVLDMKEVTPSDPTTTMVYKPGAN